MNKNELWMIWENPNKTERRRYKIGVLSYKDDEYNFVYTDPEITEAQNAGFLPFPGFEDIKKRYTSDKLFPNIYRRLPNIARDDYNDIKLRYDIIETDNDFTILRKTKGRLITDTIEFVEPFDKNIFSFDVAGIRYYDIKTVQKFIQVNDRVKFAIDKGNKKDKYAVKVLYILNNIDHILGYVPRFYSKEIYSLLLEGENYTALIGSYNFNKCIDDYNSVEIRGTFS